MSQRIEQQAKLQEPKTLTRHWDAFGRNVGYSVDGDRKQSITYDSVTGRIAESDGFRWDYLAGSNLKSKLTYPNDAVVTWTYEPHRDLLTAVTNATYSTYVYTNDLLGRRTSKNDEQYGYNVRDELISADEVSYNYDDIGNRTTAEGKTYTANNLNQYTAIDDFVPQYDDDGNQTLIKTETGIWSVLYNAENRPIRWQSGDTVITMSFDRMGRRVEMRTVKDSEETLQRFVYDNYLCIQQLRGPDNSLYHSYIWDPTEPIATRPLVSHPASGETAYIFHDGNKNVSDLISISGYPIHYTYTPFGSKTASAPSENPYNFSSEVYDTTLGVSYYNYRHYASNLGRWNSRDHLGEYASVALYVMLNNKMGNEIDFLGEDSADERCSKAVDFAKRKNKKVREMLETIQNGKKGDDTPWNVPPIKCNCCENEDAYGFFDPNEKNITLCSNVATTAELVIETLAHELQHALDDCLSNSNWSCEERACSEIKAADRDGGCRKNGSARKKNETYRECVKRNAAASTSVDKTCSNNGWDAVEKMFRSLAIRSAPL